ncbi:MAG: asparagine synthase (glutamine-hydrolyzing) [bacterium]|nr:asparagine synthase (glutamine-hydrolyzing) [bacterium]
MCGIAGYFQLEDSRPPDRDLVTRMISLIRHRGPDEFGAFLDDKCVLGHARLSIIDLSTGQQPLCNEDETVWIAFNGEIYNYIELRPILESFGHKFRTNSDTEVIVHAYEQWGRDCLERFNGQFSFAIYDSKKQSLFSARDRMGKRPLFYTVHNGRFYFASEIKALFADPTIERRLDASGLDQVFTWWTCAPPRTVFSNVQELESGSFLEIDAGKINTARFWSMQYPDAYDSSRSVDSWAEELHALLVDSIRLRLRADVPVGAYLSGGLDSSAIAALVRSFTSNRLESFSIAFGDSAFDESNYQKQMADQLGTHHHSVQCNYSDIANCFPEIIWHTERPILRTAPAPMYLLSKLVNDTGFKVVLTGEGSDEMFAGYDIFKESKIRRFWARNPDSRFRALLLKRLYPTLPLSDVKSDLFLQEFYREGLTDTDRYYYSHMLRIKTSSRVKDFYALETKSSSRSEESLNAFAHTLPAGFAGWHHLSQAQFVEAKSLLSGYLLSSQGDRMAAANAVEGRYPFLDHRVIEFAAKIPPQHKLFGLKEKWVLKRAMRGALPEAILKRPKQPYMAPDSNCFTQKQSPEYVRQLLSPDRIKRAGVFNPVMAGKLYEKCLKQSQVQMSFKDNMAFVGILSTQLLVDQFIENFDARTIKTVSNFRVWRDYSSAQSDHLKAKN